MGYFRFLYYISYIFNTVSRLIRRNKKFFMILLIVGIVLFFFLNNKSQAYYYADYEYADSNYALNSIYNDINLDFLKRLDNYNGANKETFLNLLKNNSYSFYLYYGVPNGTDMLNGTTYNHANLRILVYSNSIRYLTINASVQDNYFNVSPVDIKEITTSNYFLYYFDAIGDLYEYPFNPKPTSYTVSIPSQYINFINSYSFNYLFNNYSLEQIELLAQIDSNVNEINESITNNDMTQEQEEETNEVIEDSQEIFDTEYSNDYHSYINSFYTSISNQISDYVSNPGGSTYIDFTLPFVNYTYRLHSNSISTVLLLHDKTHVITNFITLFWWVTFSIPIFYLLRRIIIWFGTGEFLNKPSKFAVYMTDFIDKNITPGMM